jgi:pimeloyl-ACP methyl ester carboxylesterase
LPGDLCCGPSVVDIDQVSPVDTLPPVHCSSVRLSRTLFPNHQGLIIAKGNHFPMLDDPDLFASTLRTWWHENVSPSMSKEDVV